MTSCDQQRTCRNFKLAMVSHVDQLNAVSEHFMQVSMKISITDGEINAEMTAAEKTIERFTTHRIDVTKAE